ncbi:MAG: PBP1A family penicillin-binding protein [Firmicutes bacterium]|nr:PBP1A family penicillin-binding protein [Bacillota bacterium]
MRPGQRSTVSRRRIGSYLYPSLVILCSLLLGCAIGLFVGCARSSGELVIAPAAASIVYDAKGREVGRFFDLENREPIPLSQIPQVVRDAVIAVEDARFYTHRGVDLRAIARAAWADIRGGRYLEGGSTITQQLARNALLTQRKLLTRKIREVFYAMAIERKYSKDQILEFYLNQVYFGHGAYGIQCAAKTFFGKEAKDLDLAEAALLAAILKSPKYYDPYLYPDAARNRRAVVLGQMVKYGYITRAQAEAAKARPLGVVPPRPRERRAAYFMEYIERQLVEKFQRLELDTAGLKIYTTLDNDLQAAAEAMVAQMRPGKPDAGGVIQPQVALVALDPATGYIKAMIGGRDYGNTQLNRADRAYRQPASAIKPFVYTAAIDSREFIPSSVLLDEPVTFKNSDGTLYSPQNYDGKFRGPVTLQEALEQSINIIAIKLVERLGPSRVANYARKMGLESLVLSGRQNDLNLASMALGGLTRGVTPLELAAAYTPLANRGVRVEPLAILKVTDRYGNALFEREPRRRVVLDEATAYVVTNMLRRVVTHGTGRQAYLDELHPVAGKTGTATRNVNAWFVGYTPNLLAAVWIGNDRQDQPLPFGSAEAARLWAVFMRRAVDYLPPANFVPPAGVTPEIAICKKSGELFTERCPASDQDFAVFLEGTQPRTPCHLHAAVPSLLPENPGTPSGEAGQPSGEATPSAETVTVMVCRKSGALANPFCPEEEVEKKTFRRGEEPTQYCTLHGPWSKP